MIECKNKWAFITGASRGIGKEIAKFMANKGCNLILHSRNLEHTEVLKNSIKGVEIKTIACELSDNTAIKNMLSEIDQYNIDIDFVFNNAGVQIAYRQEYFQTPVEDFTISNQINLVAPAMICYHFIPKMIDRGFGRIINTTSGIQLEPQQAGYSVSKAGLDKFTIDLGNTLIGTGVQMNLTDPGWCRTDLGGPQAPNDVTSTIPGVVLPAFLNDDTNGNIFSAQDYAGLTLNEALELFKKECL